VSEPSLIIEAFDPALHDRASFSCGVEQVDNFFRRTANKLASADNLRVFVLATEAHEVIGFYAVNAHAVDYENLPASFARTRLGHGSIPAAYISMMGVDVRYGGKGYGGYLLADALKRLAAVADNLGVAAVVLDVLDDGVPTNVSGRKVLYERYGFQPFPSNPLRLFVTMGTIRRLLS